jgi:pyruvate ferredoxin oxidoreductase delta subunit
MYAVAAIIEEACIAGKGCRLCMVYCPEADTITYDPVRKVAVVNEARCKGCELCVLVCSKHHAIKMVAPAQIACAAAQQTVA